MAIETLEDLNAQSCCCDLILCPVPEMVCESVWGQVAAEFYYGHFTDGAGTRYKQEVTTYASCDYARTEVLSGYYNATYPDGTTLTETLTITYSGTNSGCGASTTVKSDPITWADWMAGAEALLDANKSSLDLAEGAWTSSSCSSAREALAAFEPSDIGGLPYDGAFRLRKEWSRVRFKIPSSGDSGSFTGTYFKITYDVLEELDDGGPSIILTDQVQEWTGPGSGESDDPSWLLPWITLDPPATAGTRRIVNIRFVCRENWYIGEVPQVTGEAYPPAE